VNARALANAYAQTLGTVFTTESKPLEVELVVAEVGADQSTDQIYRLSYDGSVADEKGFVVMGGQAEELGAVAQARWHEGLDLAEALRLAVDVLATTTEGPPKELDPNQLEVAVLDRTRPRRAFRRISPAALDSILARKA